MRPLMLFLLLPLVGSLLRAYTAQAQNLLLNPGFEAGTSGWRKYGGTLDTVPTPAHEGAAAARHTHTKAGTKYIYQTVAITPGTTYDITAWVLADTPGIDAVWIRVAWYPTTDCSGAQAGTADSPPLATPLTTWQQLHLAWTAPPTAQCLSLRLVSRVTTPGAITYWDTVALTPATPPPPSPTPTATPTLAPTATSTPVPFIAINEFLPAPAGTVDWDGNGTADSNDEWVELYNPNPFAVDLSGWQVDDAPGGSSPYTLPAGTTLAPHGFLLLFKARTGIALNNSGDAVRLLAPDGHTVDSVTYPAVPRTDATSWSRTADGTGTWTDAYPPSPGAPNRPPTPTPTPLPADVTFRGWVYRGHLGETHTPLPGVRVVLYGRRSGDEEIPLAEYTSYTNGWFGLSTRRAFPTYVIRAEPPPGMVLHGAWTGNANAQVEGNAIVYRDPPNGTHVRNAFFLADAGAAVGPGGPGSLLIQEVLFDPSQSGRQERRHEWAELYNPLRVPVPLTGWTLADASGQADPLPDVVLPPGGFIVLAADVTAFREDFPRVDAPVYSVPDGALGNGLANRGDALYLRNPLGLTVDALSWGNNADALSPPAPRAPAGASLERLPPYRDTNTAADWTVQSDPAPGRAGPLPTANPTPSPTPTPTPSPTATPTSTSTPTAPPTPTPSSTPTATPSPTPAPTATHTPTPTATPTASPTPTPTPTTSPTPSPTPTPVPFIAINEFLPAPAGTVDWDGDGKATYRDEWIELYNPNGVSVDLGGWWLDDGPGGSRAWRVPPGTVIAARGFRVFFRRETGLALNNGGDMVRLLAPDGRLVDVVSYPGRRASDATSWSRTSDGAGAWTDTYPPSPGKPNRAPTPTPPPPPPPPTPTPVPTVRLTPQARAVAPVPYRALSLYQLHGLPEGTRVEVRGVITLPPGWLSKRAFYIGAVGAGIRVYAGRRAGPLPTLQTGDWVRIRGHIAIYRGEVEIFVSRPGDIRVLRRGVHLYPKNTPLTTVLDHPGTLVRVQGTVHRRYRRTFILRVGDTQVYVYAPRTSGISLRGMHVGDVWQVTGVVARGRKGWEVVMRGPADLRRGYGWAPRPTARVRIV